MLYLSGDATCHRRFAYARRLITAVVLASVTACALVACGGSGSSSSVGVLGPVATATPLAPAQTSIGVTALPTSIPFDAGSAVGRASFAAATASVPTSATLDLSAASSAPAGAPAQSSGTRGLAFLSVTASATVTISGLPAFTLTASGASASAGAMYVAYFDPTNPSPGWQVIEGPGIVSGSSVTFAAPATPITFAAGQTYVFELFQSTAGSSPIAVSPSSLSFLGTSLADATLVTVSEPGYAGAFTMRSTCDSIATIKSSGSQYIVIPVAAGACSATFSDTNGNSAVLPVVVTVTTGGGH